MNTISDLQGNMYEVNLKLSSNENKIKVIDLLNKIAKGEKVPEKIKWNDDEWVYYDGSSKNYYNDYEDLFSVIDGSNLNDEVEIIEEDKEIKKIKQYYDKDLDEYVVETYINGINYKEIYKSRYDEMMIKKISELIDEVNKLKRGE